MYDQVTVLKQSLYWLGPSILLLAAGCLILCGPLLTGRGIPRDDTSRRGGYALLALAAVAVAMGWHLLRMGQVPATALSTGLFTWDGHAFAAERLSFLGCLLLILIGWSTAPRRYLPEFFGCLLILTAATAIVGAANDMISLFLALELVSIPTYIILGTVRSETPALESALKYFLLSAMASAIFLFGISYLYGCVGTTDLNLMPEALGNAEAAPLPMLGMLFVVMGLAFRITAVPFQFYGPDVFQGTSLATAAMLSYIPKVAGFLALTRVLTALPPSSPLVQRLVPVVLVLAVLTFTVGNVMAAIQKNLRRLLGYSSVAHSGYLLLGLAVVMIGGADPRILYIYLIVYAVMTLGMFAVLAEFEAAGGRTERITDLTGMFFRRPAAACAAVVCLISLIGFPPTAGLWVKIQIMWSGVWVDRPDFLPVVILMAINAVIAAGYYFRVMRTLFDRSESTRMTVWRPSLFVAYTFCAAMSLIWFFVPTGL